MLGRPGRSKRRSAPLGQIYLLFLQSKRTGQWRGGGLCETAADCLPFIFQFYG